MKRAVTMTAGAVLALTGTLAAQNTADAAGTVVAQRVAAWEDVQDYDGTIWKGRGGDFDTYNTATTLQGKAIPHTRHDPLYGTSMWGMKAWSTPVPASGTYRVTLFMAEDWADTVGQRVFDVTAEGQTVLSDVDIVKAVGKNTAYQPSFRVTVTDGRLDIGWVAKADWPLLNAIRVVKTGDGTAPPENTGDDQVAGLPVRWAANSVYAIDLRNAPLDPRSATAAHDLATQVAGGWWGPKADFHAYDYTSAFNVVDSTTPTQRMRFYDCQGKGYTPAGMYDGPAHFANVPIPPNLVIASGTDKATTIYRPDTDQLWEFWVTEPVSTGGYRACWGGRIDQVSTNRGVFPRPWGVQASGLAMVGSSITPEDVRRGHIDHAVGIVVPQSHAGGQYWPATRNDGNSDSAVWEGMRFRLPADLDLDQYELTPIARMLAESAKKYGLVVVDTSVGTVAVNGMSGETEKAVTGVNPWDELIAEKGGGAPYATFVGFPWDRLQVVQETWGQ